MTKSAVTLKTNVIVTTNILMLLLHNCTGLVSAIIIASKVHRNILFLNNVVDSTCRTKEKNKNVN